MQRLTACHLFHRCCEQTTTLSAENNTSVESNCASPAAEAEGRRRRESRFAKKEKVLFISVKVSDVHLCLDLLALYI